MDTRQLSVTNFLQAVTSGSLSITEVAEQTSAAIEDRKNLNTIISSNEKLLAENALTLQQKLSDKNILPLHGLPVLVKDNIDTEDFPTSAACPALSEHQPKVDAGVVRRLKEAGALIVGKANMHELAFGITSNNAFTGAVHNPYNESCIPGGSSGGSAAAVSAGIVPVALGSDTGGSNRIPASLCGVCGFRPSLARYPDDHLVNLSKTRDTVGIFAASVDDIIPVDAVLAENAKPVHAELQSLRIAVPRDPFFKDLENETAKVMETTLATLNNAGVNLIEIDMPDVFLLNEKISFPVALFENIRELREYLQVNKIGITLEELTDNIASPDVKHIMQAALGEQNVPEEIYLEAIKVHRPQLIKMYADFFSDNKIDAMIYPTAPLTARPIGQDEMVEVNGQQVPTFPSYTRNGDPSSNAGIPSLSIPAGLASNGLPVGLSIDGPEGLDDEVLAIGSLFDSIIPKIKGPFA
ncbi:MAG: indoleacetamide hydrolase [Gammaproteobacteria bacterium]|nr:indoleacetamide hydrolase [Gammaproteobacteria bacterium]